MRVALVGNPNCGKTTLFNALTGARQSVGNWPGVTVEKKQGLLRGADILLCDLPGVYSLTPYSPEERITRQYLLDTPPELVLQVVDGANLERNLYLTSQLLELGLPLVVAVNRMDVLQQTVKPDVTAMQAALGVPVFGISAAKKQGLQALIEGIVQALAKAKAPPKPGYPLRSAARRYAWAEGVCRQALPVAVDSQIAAVGRVDRLLIGSGWGIVAFFAVIFLAFFITFGPLGGFLSAQMDVLINGRLAGALQQGLQDLGWHPANISLVCDGLLGGIGALLAFLPQLTLLFFCLAVLEDSGYMARVAFLLDRPMRVLGLSGRAFVPLFLGYGCTASAVLATRTLESVRDKRLTVLLLPFMSCSAKLPVYGLFAAAFFPGQGAAVVFALYLLGLVAAIGVGLVLKKTLLRGQDTPLVLELPAYRLPTFVGLWRQVWHRLREFWRKLGTLLPLVGVVLWVLRSYDLHLRPVPAKQSILAELGGWLAPLLVPLGFGFWQAAVALLSGLAAKETVVSTLAMLYAGGVGTAFTPASATSFLAFVLLYSPCMAAIAATARELSGKWAIFSLLLQTVVAWVVAFLVFWGVRALGIP